MDAAKRNWRGFIEQQSIHYNQLPHSQCLPTDAQTAAPSYPTLVRHGPARMCTSMSDPRATAPFLATQMTCGIARMRTSTDEQGLLYPQLGVTNSNVLPTYAGPRPNLIRDQMFDLGLWQNKQCLSNTMSTNMSHPGHQTQLPFLHNAYSNRTIVPVDLSLPRTTFSQGLSHTQQQTAYPMPQQSFEGQTRFPLYGMEAQINKVSDGTDVPTQSMPNSQQSCSYPMHWQNYPSVANSIITENSMEIDRMPSAYHNSNFESRRMDSVNNPVICKGANMSAISFYPSTNISMCSRESLPNHLPRNGSLYVYNHDLSQPVSRSNGINPQTNQTNFTSDSSIQIKDSCSNLQEISRLNEGNVKTIYPNRVATQPGDDVNVFSTDDFQTILTKFAGNQMLEMSVKRVHSVQVSAPAGSSNSNMTMAGSNRRQSVDDSTSIRAAFVIPQTSTTIGNAFSRDSRAEDKQLLNKWYVPPSENHMPLTIYQPISPPLCQPISLPSDHCLSEPQETTLCSPVTGTDSTAMIKVCHDNTLKPTICTEDVIEYKVVDLLHHLPSQYVKFKELKASNSIDSILMEPTTIAIKSAPSTEADSLKLNLNLRFDGQLAAEAISNMEQEFNYIHRSPMCFEHHVDTAAILDENKRKIETELVLNSQFDSQDISTSVDFGDYIPSCVMSKSLSPVNILYQMSQKMGGKLDTCQTALTVPTCAVQDTIFMLPNGNTSVQDIPDKSTKDNKNSARKKRKSSCEASLTDDDIHLKNCTPPVLMIMSRPGGSHPGASRGEETLKIRITRPNKSRERRLCRVGHAKGEFFQEPVAMSLNNTKTTEKSEDVDVVLDLFSEEEQQNTLMDLPTLKRISSLREHCKSDQESRTSKDDGLPLDCDNDMENIPLSVLTSSSNSEMGDLVGNSRNKLSCSVNNVVSGNSSNDTIETKDELNSDLNSDANTKAEIDVEVLNSADAVCENICNISDTIINNNKSDVSSLDESTFDSWKEHAANKSEPSAQLCNEISTRNIYCNENNAKAESKTIYCASETHQLTWVRFHGKVVTSLITPDGHFFILKEILKRCFRIQKPNKENFDKIQVVRRNVLKIPDVELDRVLYHSVCATLLQRKVIKAAPKTFCVISELNANRLFHYVCKTEFCNHGCVIPYSKSESPASTKCDFDSRDIAINSTHTDITTNSKHVNSNIPTMEQGSEMVPVTNTVPTMEQGSEMVPVTNTVPSMEQSSEMVPVTNTLKRNTELDILKKAKITDTLKKINKMETVTKNKNVQILKKVKRLDVKQDKNIVKHVNRSSQKFDDNFNNIYAQKSEERLEDSVTVINLCSDEEDGFETDDTFPYIDGVPCERLMEVAEEYIGVNNSGSKSPADISTVSCNDKSVLTDNAGKDIDIRETLSGSVIDLTDTAQDSLQLVSDGNTGLNVHDNHMSKYVTVLNVSDCKSAMAVTESVCCIGGKLEDTPLVTNDYGHYEDKSYGKESTSNVITNAEEKLADTAVLGIYAVQRGSATIPVHAKDNCKNINAVIDNDQDRAVLEDKDCAIFHEITCDMRQSVCNKLVEELNLENYYGDDDDDDIEMLQFHFPPDDFNEDVLEENKRYLHSLTQQCNSVTREDSRLPRLIDEMLAMGEPLVNWTRVVSEKIKKNVKRFSVEDEDSLT